MSWPCETHKAEVIGCRLDFLQPLSQVQKNHVVLCMEDNLETRLKDKRCSVVLAFPATASALMWIWKRRSEVTRVLVGTNPKLWGRSFQELVQLRTSQPHLDSSMGSAMLPG